MSEFLLENGADVNVRDTFDYIPLHKAIFHHLNSTVQILYKNGTDGALISMSWLAPPGFTMLQVLLDNSANIDAQCASGSTILHYLVQYGYCEYMIGLLLERGTMVGG